jgi:uncharacterized integral membrane protein
MSTLSRAIALIVLVLIFLLSVGFSFFNTQQVPLSFGFFVLSAQPLALWVLGAFATGGVLGLLLGSGLFRRWRQAREITQLRAHITRLEKTVAMSDSANHQQGR